jgi:hypothetical protein
MTPLAVWARYTKTAIAIGANAGASLVAGSQPRSPQPIALSITPNKSVYGAHVRAVVHLRGLIPNSAIDVQIKPPAPTTFALVDIHMHASTLGTADQPITFDGFRSGLYTVFVTSGRYADPRSSIKGSVVEMTLPVVVSGPFLALNCTMPIRGLVACILKGYGFSRYEHVGLVYRTSIGAMDGSTKKVVYRRIAVADQFGLFERPALRFKVDPRIPTYQVQVDARGSQGNNANVGSGGIS